MKKFFITILVALTTLSFISCNGSSKSDRLYLEHMRDSIQNVIVENQEFFDYLTHINDSIFDASKKRNLILLSEGDIWTIKSNLEMQDRLTDAIKSNKEKLYQLDLEIHKR